MRTAKHKSTYLALYRDGKPVAALEVPDPRILIEKAYQKTGTGFAVQPISDGAAKRLCRKLKRSPRPA
jgi:hypothetical protein